MPAYNNTSVEIIDIPDFNQVPQGMPWVFDSMSLAHSLGIRNRTLMHAVIKRAGMYKRHHIPKKSGGKRLIHAPDRMLKFIQGRILNVFLDKLEYPDHVGAYVPGKTTRDTAEVHAGKPILIVMDIKDFFPSTRRSWIRRLLQEEFHYPHKVASLLSDLMTVPMDFSYGRRYVVPQGAPTSGSICNWVANQRLDPKVIEISNRYGMAYTRYADDLAFSNEERLDRETTNAFLKEISKAIKESGYTLNRKKTRVARSGRQQRLLGMTINEKPNVMRLQARKFRARIHHCKMKGFDVVAKEMGMESGEKLKSQITGTISYYHMISPDKAQKFKDQMAEAEAAWA